jgi:oligoendopeptidase F
MSRTKGLRPAAIGLLLTVGLMIPMSVAISAPETLNRDEIPDAYKWHVNDIYPDFAAWDADYAKLEAKIGDVQAMQGTLSQGPDKVLAAYRLQDDVGQMMEKVWYFVNLQRDQDLRNNEMNARRQRVQALFAKYSTATAWFEPELLQIPEDVMKGWLDSHMDLNQYRFAILELYRQQEHVLDERGETLLSYGSQFRSTPGDIYSMLSTADQDWKTITLSSGEEVQVTTGQYYSRLQTERNQQDREAIWRAFFEPFDEKLNTYAGIYNAICQRDWMAARQRNYSSTLEAALHTNDIPTSVYENLLTVTKNGSDALARYFELRRKVLGLDKIDIYDGYVSLVEDNKKYDYDEAKKWVIASVAPLGKDYQKEVKEGIESGWIDVYENEGKRSGAYSAGVYGVHPYMLLNYSDALNDVFTLAHEMGHSMHTVLANESQPYVYSDYTIFVAEVASTLNEGLLLDYLLGNTKDPKERVLLLQHAIDQIALTFFRQVCFADFELQAHRLVEKGEPVTADGLNDLYHGLLEQYYGKDVALDPLYGITWARIPHFYNSPYYVYQYATCFASSARLLQDIRSKDESLRKDAVQRYLNLLRAGGSDHPMDELKAAGVDLSKPETVQAVIDQMNGLVDRLEKEILEL